MSNGFNGVQLIHTNTGIEVKVSSFRSQAENMIAARRLLAAKLQTHPTSKTIAWEYKDMVDMEGRIKSDGSND